MSICRVFVLASTGGSLAVSGGSSGWLHLNPPPGMQRGRDRSRPCRGFFYGPSAFLITAGEINRRSIKRANCLFIPNHMGLLTLTEATRDYISVLCAFLHVNRKSLNAPERSLWWVWRGREGWVGGGGVKPTRPEHLCGVPADIPTRL